MAAKGMTSKERFLLAMTNGVPDRVPVAPDFSNYIPAKRTGRPFWEIYFEGKQPLWKAYLETVDYFGADAWMASCTGAPFTYGESRVKTKVECVMDQANDAMIQKIAWQTPDGPLTAQNTCFRADPPSPTEKAIKDLAADFKKYKWLMNPPVGVNLAAVNEMRAACEWRQQAFGVCTGYPGFQGWMVSMQGGVAGLAYAEMDTPAILQEWFERDLENGTRAMTLILDQIKPDYLLFGGSGTITLASPTLARKYAIPALKKWSAMAKAAGIPTMLHSCGKARALVDMLADETDVNCINPLEIAPMGDVDLAEVKKARGKQISLMGNLHTTDVMLRGTPELVREKAIQAMRDAGTGGGFILSTGDQCGRETPDENLFALVAAAKEFGAYDRRTGKLPKLK